MDQTDTNERLEKIQSVVDEVKKELESIKLQLPEDRFGAKQRLTSLEDDLTMFVSKAFKSKPKTTVPNESAKVRR